MESTSQTNGSANGHFETHVHATSAGLGGDAESSASITRIATALCKAQARVAVAIKDKRNDHFGSSYVDLAGVWEACRVPLAENGLSIVQLPSADGSKVTLTTILLHDSGEWIRGRLTVTARDAGPQSVGSCITYMRRFALAAMVGVVADDDDDGNAASPPPPQQQRRNASQGQQQRNQNQRPRSGGAENTPTAAQASPPPASPPSGAAPETDDQKIERWSKAMKACTSTKQFEECVASMSAERLSVAVRAALSPLYLELKAKWMPEQTRKGAKKAEQSKPQAGPCSICGDKEHGSSTCPNASADERAEALRRDVTGPEAA